MCEKDGGIAQFYLQLRGGKMMMAGGGGGGAAVDHNGIFTNPNLHSLQQTHMDADNPDSRKRPLETPAEEAGCTKRTNTGGKRKQPIHLFFSTLTLSLCCAQRQSTAFSVIPKPHMSSSGRHVGFNMQHLCTWHFEILSVFMAVTSYAACSSSPTE